MKEQQSEQYRGSQEKQSLGADEWMKETLAKD